MARMRATSGVGAGFETLGHADLADMPDVGGTNTDHDARYVVSYFALTKADANFPNSRIHPNTGAPNYNVLHNVSDLFADADLDLGAYNLITTGNLSDGTNELTVANAKTAFDHVSITDNPHSADTRYLKLDGSNANTNIDIGLFDFTAVDVTGTGTGQFAAVNATDEDNSLQINGTTILRTGTAANHNIFLGAGSFETDGGVNNVGIGYQAGVYNDASGSPGGDENVYIGTYAGAGKTALVNNTGYQNVAIGFRALYYNTSGYRNFGLGTDALKNHTSGNRNFAAGYAAGFNLTTGTYNTIIGDAGLFYNQEGGSNVCIGVFAGGLDSGAVNNLNHNVFLGTHSGRNANTTTGNVFLGYSAGRRQTTISNRLIIDNQDRGSAANELAEALIYGVFDNISPASQWLLVNGLLKGSYGAKIGDGGTTDYSEIETDGTLVFNGAATVWKDINLAGYLLAKPAASAPDEDTFVDENGNDTTIETYAFAVGEKVHGGFELQHDYKEGSDFTFHVHWQGVAAPTGTDNVQWRLNYIVARDGTTINAAVEIDSPDTPIDTQYGSYRTDFAAITGTDFKIGDQFMFTLTRVTATGDAYAGDALIETAGIHYEVDTVGSRLITTK